VRRRGPGRRRPSGRTYILTGRMMTTFTSRSDSDPGVLSAAAAETLELLRTGADHPLVKDFPAGAMLIFDHDLRYLCAGGLALADVGLSTALMEGKTIFEVFQPDFIAVIEPQYHLALSGVESAIDLHYAGNVYSQRLAPVRDRDGTIVAGMGYTQDVTQARRADRRCANPRNTAASPSTTRPSATR
jgi:PAS fold